MSSQKQKSTRGRSQRVQPLRKQRKSNQYNEILESAAMPSSTPENASSLLSSNQLQVRHQPTSNTLSSVNFDQPNNLATSEIFSSSNLNLPTTNTFPTLNQPIYSTSAFPSCQTLHQTACQRSQSQITNQQTLTSPIHHQVPPLALDKNQNQLHRTLAVETTESGQQLVVISRDDLSYLVKATADSIAAQYNKHLAATSVKLDNLTQQVNYIAESIENIVIAHGNDCVGRDIAGLRFPLQSAEDVFQLDKMLSDHEAKQAILPNLVNIFQKAIQMCRFNYIVHISNYYYTISVRRRSISLNSNMSKMPVTHAKSYSMRW